MRFGGSDFGEELRRRRRRVPNQNLFVAAFQAAEQRNVRLRHAKCMCENAYESIIGGAVDGRCADPHEKSAVAPPVDAFTRRSWLNPNVQHTVAATNFQPVPSLGGVG